MRTCPPRVCERIRQLVGAESGIRPPSAAAGSRPELDLRQRQDGKIDAPHRWRQAKQPIVPAHTRKA